MKQQQAATNQEIGTDTFHACVAYIAAHDYRYQPLDTPRCHHLCTSIGATVKPGWMRVHMQLRSLDNQESCNIHIL